MKTLQDRPVLRAVRKSTVGALGRVRVPALLPDRRLPFERNVYQVEAAVVLVRLEDDSDFHLVLRDGSAQMIGGGTPSEAQSRATSAIVS